MLIGDAVKITAGPFAGLQGILKASGPRVLIAIELTGRQVDVEMDLDWVSAVGVERIPAAGFEQPANQNQGKSA